MCGIFGIITNNINPNIYKIIIDGLIQLKNRGYDSSGLSVINRGKIETYKYASCIDMTSIDKLIGLGLSISIEDEIYMGIGHNRWATHGAKNDINSHPHISNDEKFVLVHNGIIENYTHLKNFLISEGFTFYSQTDTEVIVNLVSYFYRIKKNTFESIKETIKLLQGTYGIILMNTADDNKMYCVRNGSPLLVGITDEYAIITSEQSGFCNLVNNYITLNNDDICTIDKTGNKIAIETSTLYTHKKVNFAHGERTPAPFTHWTLKEIHEQPRTILNTINQGGRIKNNSEVKLGGLDEDIELLKKIDNIVLLGCGTSYHSGIYGMHFLKNLCNFNTVLLFDGADFSIIDIPRMGNTAFVFISQSGETKDLHRCIQIAKDNNILTIGIINVVDSLIAREVDCGIYCNAGREIGVASTKAFTGQVLCLSMLAIWFAQIHHINENKRINMIQDLHNLSMDFKKTIDIVEEDMKKLSAKISGTKSLFVLGKNVDECIAREGSLKIKEISYIHSEGYSASSLKHGPFALLDENMPVILLNLMEEHSPKVLNCFEEIYSRNSPILFITNNTIIEVQEKCDIIIIPKNYSYNSLLGIIPLQLLAYYLSVNKGINPDIPKNLAKVVTVE